MLIVLVIVVLLQLELHHRSPAILSVLLSFVSLDSIPFLCPNTPEAAMTGRRDALRRRHSTLIMWTSGECRRLRSTQQGTNAKMST